MSTYHFKGKCGNNQVEVITSKPQVLERELDRYRESFMGKSVSPVIVKENTDETLQQETQEFFTQSFESQVNTSELKTEEQNNDENTISLADFLFNNDSDSVFDEFITCAFYIKKVLNKNSFTLKFLNSKFYPVANRLIDFTTAQEAKNQGLIDSWEEEGATKYSLNEKGEMFFLNQING